MSDIESTPHGAGDQAALPLRDWLLLALIGMLTVAGLAGGSEWIAGRMFTESEVGKDRCRVFTDAASGKERFASCAYYEKALETESIEYRVNSGGYRSDVEFGPKAAGTYRIVMVGSSFGWGGGTAREKTFAALLPAALSARTGKKIELYNQSIPGPPGLPQVVDRRFKDALNLQPDLILWVITRWDIKESTQAAADSDNALDAGAAPPTAWKQIKEDLAAYKLRAAVLAVEHRLREAVENAKEPLAASRSAFLLQHFLAESQSQYLQYSLSGPDYITGYLKAEPSKPWQDRLQAFDGYTADIAAQARSAGVRVAVLLVPSRAQAAMISMGKWPKGYDPYKLDDELRSISQSHGIMYLEISPYFRSLPNAERYYYPVDGHLNAAGNQIVSDLILKVLTGGGFPDLNSGSRPQSAVGKRSLP